MSCYLLSVDFHQLLSLDYNYDFFHLLQLWRFAFSRVRINCFELWKTGIFMNKVDYTKRYHEHELMLLRQMA